MSFVGVVSAGSSSLARPTVLWSQRSSVWWRLSGVVGPPSGWTHLPAARLPFVDAEPSRDGRLLLDYDRVAGVVYWSRASNSPWSAPIRFTIFCIYCIHSLGL